MGFEPTNGGFAVRRSRAKLFIFLGDFVGLGRFSMLFLPHSVSRLLAGFKVQRSTPQKLPRTAFWIVSTRVRATKTGLASLRVCFWSLVQRQCYPAARPFP